MKHEVREMLARMGILVELNMDDLVERIHNDVYLRLIKDQKDLEDKIKSMEQEYRSLQQEAFFLDANIHDYVEEILDFIKEEYWEKFQEFLKEDEELRSNIPKKPFKVMGTGSRSMLTDPDAKEIYSNLEAEVLHLADKYDLHLISGMAEGWDEAIAKVAMRNGIPYTVMIPNKGYGEYYWGKNSLLKKNRMNVFNELVKHATKVVYVCNSIYVHAIPKSMLNDNNTLSFDKDLEWFHPQEAEQQVLQKNRGYFADGIRFIHVEKYADTYQLSSDGTFSLIYTTDGVDCPGKIHANFIRNQAMVDECHGALVYKPQSRGTRDAVERLEKANKPYKVAPFKK